MGWSYFKPASCLADMARNPQALKELMFQIKYPSEPCSTELDLTPFGRNVSSVIIPASNSMLLSISVWD